MHSNKALTRVTLSSVSTRIMRMKKPRITKRAKKIARKFINTRMLSFPNSSRKHRTQDDDEKHLRRTSFKTVSSDSITVLVSNEIPGLSELSHVDYDDDESDTSEEEFGYNSIIEEASMEIVEDKAARYLHPQERLFESHQDIPMKLKSELWEECYCDIQECCFWYNKETLESTWVNPFQDDESMTSDKAQEEACYNAEVHDFTPKKNRNSQVKIICQEHHSRYKNEESQAIASDSDKEDEMKVMWRLLAQRRKERVLGKQYIHETSLRRMKQKQYKNGYICMILVSITLLLLLWCLMRTVMTETPAISIIEDMKSMTDNNQISFDICLDNEHFNHTTIQLVGLDGKVI